MVRAVGGGATVFRGFTPYINLFSVNKAGYTATLVACGWAGAVFELLKHLGKCSEAKDRKNIKK